jgi:hypothetical protein
LFFCALAHDGQKAGSGRRNCFAIEQGIWEGV